MRFPGTRILSLLLCYFTILCSTSKALADTVSNATSLVSYDTYSRFLCCYDNTTSSLYYCVNNHSFLYSGIKYANFYRLVDNEPQLFFRRNKYISSVYVLNETMYYVAFDSFSNRGALFALDIPTSTNTLLLSEYYGVGQILGSSDEHLYVETDNYIFTINLSDNDIRRIASKDYYVSTSTLNGITFFRDDGWYYLPWKEQPILLFNSESPPINHCRVAALAEHCYVIFNCAEKLCCIVLDDKRLQIENVNSISIDNNLIVLCCAESKIKVFSAENDIALLHEFSSDLTGQLYIIDDAIIMLGKQNMLHTYDVSNE